MYKKKSSDADYGRANQQNSCQNYQRRRRDLNGKDRLGLRLRNYPRERPNICESRLLEETLPDITVSGRVIMAYWIFPRCSKNL